MYLSRLPEFRRDGRSIPSSQTRLRPLGRQQIALQARSRLWIVWRGSILRNAYIANVVTLARKTNSTGIRVLNGRKALFSAGIRTTARDFAHSLHIIVVDAGDCGACLNEVKQLNNPFYNMHRLGFFFTPTPRAADVLSGCWTGE